MDLVGLKTDPLNLPKQWIKIQRLTKRIQKFEYEVIKTSRDRVAMEIRPTALHLFESQAQKETIPIEALRRVSHCCEPITHGTKVGPRQCLSRITDISK